MIRLKSISTLLLALILSACATKNYVKQQADPLAEKINTLTTIVSGFEAKLSGLESRLAGYESRMTGFETTLTSLDSRLNALDTKVTQLPAMDQAALKEAKDLAQAALEKANRAEEQVKAAQAAAEQANQAARKTETMFNRDQKK